jgi:hypothetical protein
MPLVTRGGDLAAAGDAVWASDPDAGELLRVDPGTREVLARVPAGGRTGTDTVLATGAGALWAVTDGRLLRIDPARGEITGELEIGERDVGFPVRGAGTMWIIDALRLRRVDPVNMTFERTVRLERSSFQARGVATDGKVIYVQLGDGSISGYDAATGDRVRSVRAGQPAYLEGAAAGGLVLTAEDRVELVDPRTNTARWLRPLGTASVNGAVVEGSTIWVHGSDDRSGRDRVWRVDARDGRVLGSVTLPDFGVTGMQPVGDDLWLVSDAGRLTVVRPR